VERWVEEYPRVCRGLEDRGGRSPQHVFFYPQEEYHRRCLEMLAELVRSGWGDVEVHLHHDNDSSQALRRKLEEFKEKLHREHGLLRRSGGGVVYGFIHGNWALDDSGPGGRFCGVRDEITVLKETGCYADFTYPSAPHPTQPPMVNRIYYATDDPRGRCSHHRGRDATFGRRPGGDLLIVTGPLTINWRRRRRLVFPALENGDLTALNPPAPDRVDLWVKTAISVAGWPRWIFVKIYTHGAQEANAAMLLGGGIARLHRYLHERYDDGESFVLHNVTAWDLYRCIRVLETADRDRIEAVEAFRYDDAFGGL